VVENVAPNSSFSEQDGIIVDEIIISELLRNEADGKDHAHVCSTSSQASPTSLDPHVPYSLNNLTVYLKEISYCILTAHYILCSQSWDVDV
jgi:hypothetical protein